MPILSSPSGKAGGSFYSNIVQSNQADAFKFQMDQLDVDIKKAEAATGGQFLDPSVYAGAIQKLQQLKATTGDPNKLQEIDYQIAQYQVSANSLVNQIAKAEQSKQRGLGTANETSAEALDALKSAYKDDKITTLQNHINDPLSFIEEWANKSAEWVDKIKAYASDFAARTGSDSTSIENYADDVESDGSVYNELVNASPDRARSYGIYVKTDDKGKISDYSIKRVVDGTFSKSSKDPSSFDASNFLPINGTSPGNMQVFLQKQFTDTGKDGESVDRARWGGVLFEHGISDKGGWRDATISSSQGESTQTDLQKIFQSSKLSTIISGSPGEVIAAPDGKKYMFGGLDGKQDVWQQVPDESTAQQLGVLDNFRNARNVTNENLGGLATAGIIGSPISKDDLVYKDVLAQKLQLANTAMTDAQKGAQFRTDVVNFGNKAEPFLGAARNILDPKQMVYSAISNPKKTLENASEIANAAWDTTAGVAQAGANAVQSKTAKEISKGRSAINFISGFLKGK